MKKYPECCAMSLEQANGRLEFNGWSYTVSCKGRALCGYIDKNSIEVYE